MFLKGDFTETDLPHMDLYLMSLVLHDWGDKQIATLLDKVHAAINKGRRKLNRYITVTLLIY